MTVDHTVEHRDRYSVVRVASDPTLDDFLSFIAELGAKAKAWPVRRLLVDLRSVRTLRTFTEHYTIGEATARHLAHMERIASVVPADRITRASEKTARLSGVQLTVFSNERDAIDWLRECSP